LQLLLRNLKDEANFLCLEQLGKNSSKQNNLIELISSPQQKKKIVQHLPGFLFPFGEKVKKKHP